MLNVIKKLLKNTEKQQIKHEKHIKKQEYNERMYELLKLTIL